MKRLLVFLAALSIVMVSGCKKNKQPTSDSEPISESTSSEETSIPDVMITVKFYLDYNQVEAKEVYHTVEVKNGSKLEEPTRPTPPLFPEFPVFKGWSQKEIIDDVKDLWNFDTDVVKVTLGTSLNLYGIWVAQGE